MNINDIVLVTILNTLPTNNEIQPNCNSMYLMPDFFSDFSFFIQERVRAELSQSEFLKDFDKIILDYLPLTSSYSNVLSFSFNGLFQYPEKQKLCPAKIAIIEPLKYHLEENFVNINPIDTTIKGGIKLSQEAILVIDSDIFKSLSIEEKTNLISYFKLELYTGDLTEAVDRILNKYKYCSLPLINESKCKYILDCPEKEQVLELQKSLAQNLNVSCLTTERLLTDIIFTNKEDYSSADKINKEYRKDLIVYEYYRNKLYEFFCEKARLLNIPLTNEETGNLKKEGLKSEQVLKKLMDKLIKEIGGMEKFKNLIHEFNQSILNNYLTNDEILALNGSSRE